MKSPNSRTRSHSITFAIALAGLILIFVGNSFELRAWNVDLNSQTANVGALILIIGILQWLFDNFVRNAFFSDLREEIIGDKHISDSGICDFYADSHDVDFSEYFLASEEVVLGINYSAKLIDNCMHLLEERTKRRRKTVIVLIEENSPAAEFLAKDYQSPPDLAGSIGKIKQIAHQFDPTGNTITVRQIPTLLRYSFVKFDSRIWVISGTNGLGRRAVPGFFVRQGSSWHAHYENDIRLLLDRAAP